MPHPLNSEDAGPELLMENDEDAEEKSDRFAGYLRCGPVFQKLKT